MKKNSEAKKRDNSPLRNVDNNMITITLCKAIRCHNCRSSEHRNESCPDKDKGRKCFKCNIFGLLAVNCSTKPNSSKNSNVS